ncbi:MAG: RNA polymerase sigma factor, partial [Planctomycetota bacterium]
MRDMQPRIDQLLAESTWVRRIALSLLHHPQDAEDVTQEVLTAAYEQRSSITGDKLRAWMRTVTKRKAARRRLLASRQQRAEAEAARPEAEKSGVTERLALHAALSQAISELPPLLAEAVLLRYFDDLSPREMAKRLGVTNEVARQRVSRGLKRLRLVLDREADPSNPERGRELWSAALVETLTLKQIAALGSLSTLMLMSLKIPSLLAASALLLAGLFWATRTPQDIDLSAPEDDLAKAELTAPELEPSLASAEGEEPAPRQALEE